MNLQDSSSRLPSYFLIFIFGIKYSNAVPDQDTNPLYPFNIVSVLLKFCQCFEGTSCFAIATRLACLASDASKS